LALSGAGATATAVVGSADTAALERDAAETTGLAQVAVHDVTHSVWPWISAGGGLLLLAAGLLALAYGRRWPAMSGRYERSGRRPPRGGDAGGDGPGGAEPGGRNPDAKPAGGEERPEEMWKALDRGEDPT
ncbi:Trp biosynthesis-associated membrane protein, partial [Streptomyces sp. SM14]|uniref:Trp biosynthesis-associated membrane protein n=2 Tax=unclassified Streptomyces TaxID=2593676 RepID=UPI0015E19A23